MATIYAIANGNWSDSSTWSTGTVPTVYDDVYANGHTVTLDYNVTANLITNRMCPLTSTSGGYFTISTNTTNKNVVINASIEGHQSGDCVRIAVGNNIQGGSITITGDHLEGQGGSYALSTSQGTNNANYTLTFTVNANLYDRAVNITGTGFTGITINGDLINQSTVVLNQNSANNSWIVINGDCKSNSTSDYLFYAGRSQQSPALTINGNIEINSYHQMSSGYTFYEDRITMINGNVRLYYNSVLFVPFSSNGSFRVMYSDNSTISVLNQDYNYLVFSALPSPNLNYPPEQDVKSGVIYGMQNEYEGQYDEILDQQTLQRIANCVTNDTLQATMEDYFGGE